MCNTGVIIVLHFKKSLILYFFDIYLYIIDYIFQISQSKIFLSSLDGNNLNFMIFFYFNLFILLLSNFIQFCPQFWSLDLNEVFPYNYASFGTKNILLYPEIYFLTFILLRPNLEYHP